MDFCHSDMFFIIANHAARSNEKMQKNAGKIMPVRNAPGPFPFARKCDMIRKKKRERWH